MNTTSSFKNILQTLMMFVLLLLTPSITFAYDPNEDTPVMAEQTPKELEGVGLVDKSGEQLSIDIPFLDQSGKTVNLGDILSNGKPAMLSIVYYGCPNLCNIHLDGVVAGLKGVPWSIGKEFSLIAISMDSEETPDLASEKMQNYMQVYGRVGSEPGWHFLTGTKENIKTLTDQLGFSFKWNPEENQWAHSASAYLLTPSGKISRSLPGVAFDEKVLKLGLQEASNNKIGNIIDQLILYCYKFDPKKNKYTIYAFNLMRIGGLITILVMAGILLPVWIKESRRGGVA